MIRFGGDELLVVWDGDEVVGAACSAVDSIRTLSVRTFEEPKERIAVTVSAGVGSGPDSLAALRAAEEALGRAKVNGRDRVEV